MTLGRRWGWYAIFCQWAGITIAFLAMMYFVISGLGFIFGGTAGYDLLTQGFGGNSFEYLQPLPAYYKPGAINAVYNAVNFAPTSTSALAGANSTMAQPIFGANGQLDLSFSPYQVFGYKIFNNSQFLNWHYTRQGGVTIYKD